MLDQGVNATEADRGSDELDRAHDRCRRLEAALDLEREDGAGPEELAAVRHRVADPQHGRMPFEPPGEDARPFLRLPHAKRQRRQAPVEEVGREGMQDRAGRHAHLPEVGRPAGVASDDAGHHVAVAGEELRRALQGECRAVAGRLLEDGGGEGVVDEHRHAVGRGDRLLDVDLGERRVLRRLEHHEGGVPAKRRCNGLETVRPGH